jgi:hypothetical protein
VSVNVYFVPEGQITYPPDITVGKILNVRNIALSFSRGLLMTTYQLKNKRLGNLMRFVYIGKLYQKHFPKIAALLIS